MLTPDQLTAIDRHLRKENWLLNEELIDELTDHYAAGITDRLAAGMPFDAALREIHTGFGGRKGLLKMEEDSQIQSARRITTMEWKLIHSFMQGSRWPLSVSLFIGVYTLNTFMGLEETIKSGLGIGLLYASSSVLFALIRGVVFFYQNRREVSHAVRLPGSPIYIIAYGLSMALLLLNKYLFPNYDAMLSGQMVTLLESILEALGLLYYVAIVLTIKNVFGKNRSHRLRKAA